MTQVKRGTDSFVAKIIRCEVGPIQKKDNSGEYQGVAVEFASAKGNTWPNNLPTFADGSGAYSPTSPGGLFLDGAVNALRKASIPINEMDYDSDIFCGKVFRIEKREQKQTDPSKPANTNPVPVEYLGEDFPAQ